MVAPTRVNEDSPQEPMDTALAHVDSALAHVDTALAGGAEPGGADPGGAGLELAEGFRRYKGHPYPQSALLEELLGSAVAAPRV